jgi:DNA polymerase-3 subunit alpha (Gram-positive type)
MKDDIIKKITLEINKIEALEEKELIIIKFQFLRKSNILKVVIRGKNSLSVQEEQQIKTIVSRVLLLQIEIEILFYRDASDITLNEIVKNHWIECISNTIKRTPLCRPVLLNCKKSIQDNNITILNGYEKLTDHLKSKEGPKEIETNIENMFGIKCRVNVIYDESLEVETDFKEKEKKEKALLKEIFQGRNIDSNSTVEKPKEESSKSKEKKTYEKREGGFKREVKSENSIYGRNISIEATPIKDINETSGYVAVLGEVFKTDIIETKTGKTILTFYITDYTSSITVKCFLKPQEKEEVLDNVKKGLYCKVRGEAVYDTYAREVVIMGRDILRMKKIERMDESEEKRVELHCHTTMSAMDGVANVSKLIERAAKWGHSAIAITDHGVVQAFPDAQSSAKKNKIKVLYGVEGYIVDDGVPLALNEKGQTLEDTYVIFDLETTGFSSKNDKIIEIGAVKIKDGLL